VDSPKVSTSGELGQDVFVFPSIEGSRSGPLVSSPNFMFSCGATFQIEGLARGANGMAGLGRNRIGMPIQLAVEFQLRPEFAICLSSSTSSDGVIFFGEGPYKLLPNVDVSQFLTYTPLFINRVSTAGSYVKGEKSVEYFIGVKSIKVNDKVVHLNATLLAINKRGVGGTKISTVTPYTTLETSIYKAVTHAFAAALSKIKRVAPVAPFQLCYSAKDIGSTRVGPAVPAIDLVLQNETVFWRIFGANSMVEAKRGVLCLGFVDGGMNPTTSIVIGGYQIEDNLLQFDLKNMKLGFTSSLLFKQTTCANFDFKGKP